MPPGYDVHDERIEVFLPLTIDPKTFPKTAAATSSILIGRLKDGVSPQAGAGGSRPDDGRSGAGG